MRPKNIRQYRCDSCQLWRLIRSSLSPTLKPKCTTPAQHRFSQIALHCACFSLHRLCFDVCHASPEAGDFCRVRRQRVDNVKARGHTSSCRAATGRAGNTQGPDLYWRVCPRPRVYLGPGRTHLGPLFSGLRVCVSCRTCKRVLHIEQNSDMWMPVGT